MADRRRDIVVGSRKSELAMIQSRTIIAALERLDPTRRFTLTGISTTGDRVLDVALSKIGEKSLFTKELEVALADRRVDIVVHSLKDLPTLLPPGMTIGAVHRRDDPRDAVVVRPDHARADRRTLAALPRDATIGTSSLRRIAQLRHAYPHLTFSDVRGNLNTRLRKLDDGVAYDALVLAVSGLERMGWSERISQTLDVDSCLYAVSQGALAVETRSDDHDILNLLASLNCVETAIGCAAERAFLRKLEGGCSVPVGVSTSLDENGQKLTMHGIVCSLDGSERVKSCLGVDLPAIDSSAKELCETGGMSVTKGSLAAIQKAEQLGEELAACLLGLGAGPILVAARAATEKN